MLLETDKAILGKIFKKYRIEKGLTQFELAEKIGLNEKQISRIEAGTNYPTYLTFVNLLNILEINISDIQSSNLSAKSTKNNDLSKIAKNSTQDEIKMYIDVLKVIKKNLKMIAK